jgi:hypothetical protein
MLCARPPVCTAALLPQQGRQMMLFPVNMYDQCVQGEAIQCQQTLAATGQKHCSTEKLLSGASTEWYIQTGGLTKVVIITGLPPTYIVHASVCFAFLTTDMNPLGRLEIRRQWRVGAGMHMSFGGRVLTMASVAALCWVLCWVRCLGIMHVRCCFCWQHPASHVVIIRLMWGQCDVCPH